MDPLLCPNFAIEPHTCQEIPYGLQIYVPVLAYPSFEGSIYRLDVDSRGDWRSRLNGLLGQRRGRRERFGGHCRRRSTTRYRFEASEGRHIVGVFEGESRPQAEVSECASGVCARV